MTYTLDEAVVDMSNRIVNVLGGPERLAASLVLTLVKHVPVIGSWNHRRIVGIYDDWEPHRVAYLPARVRALALPSSTPAAQPPNEVGSDDDDDFAVMPSPSPFSVQCHRTHYIEAVHALAGDLADVADEYLDDAEVVDPGGVNDADGAIEVEDVDSEASCDECDDGFMLDVASPSPWAAVHTRLGLDEEDSVIYAAGARIGHVEWIHSTNISLKVVCEIELHKFRSCHLLMNVNRQIMEKYERALEWLLEQVHCTAEEHVASTANVRAHFGLKALAPVMSRVA